MSLKRSVIGALFGVLAGTGSASAQQAIPEWSVTGLYTKIIASDCRNCEEETGILFACTGNGQPAELTVNAAASQRGKDGAFAPVTFRIDGQEFTYRAKTVEFGLIGFTPVFQIATDDPLTAALQAGREAIVTFNGARGRIREWRHRGQQRPISRDWDWSPSNPRLENPSWPLCWRTPDPRLRRSRRIGRNSPPVLPAIRRGSSISSTMPRRGRI